MIRRLDLGAVSPLRSQAIYHGLAEVLTASTPDTIVFCVPRAPFFCVGYHQSAAAVLDLARCRRQGWPVLRRKIGGGAVYLDGGQLFYQVIAHRSRAPFRVEDVYRAFLAGPVEALRRLGLPAALRGVNEIEVGGRRIAGTGGGQLGEAVVVVGNVLLDFPVDPMARAWRAPSRPFRRLARSGLRRYVTTLRRELPVPPSPAELTERLAEAYGHTLGATLVPGALTSAESAAVGRAEAELAAEAFVLDGSGGGQAALKIARGVYVFEGGAGGGVRVAVRLRDGVVDAIAVRGADPVAARALVGRRVETLTRGAAPANPANLIGELLAAGEFIA